MEKVYKTMRACGAMDLVLGIVIAVLGITIGTLSIINGASLLVRKNDITF